MRRREFLRGLCTAAAAVAVPGVALGAAKAQLATALDPTAITSSNPGWQGSGAFTLEDLRAAVAIMRANAPTGPVVVFVHPDNLAAMRGIGCEVIAIA